MRKAMSFSNLAAATDGLIYLTRAHSDRLIGPILVVIALGIAEALVPYAQV